MASNAMRRLGRDLERIQHEDNRQLTIRPSSSNMLEWHFAVHSLPDDTPYAGGCYHGKLIFPEQYPHAPPSIVMLTPNGRLDVNRRLCLSMTDYHPESWNPAWSPDSILVGLISFMIDETEPKAVGSLEESAERRRALALNSLAFNLKSAEFRELFPELCGDSLASAVQSAEESPSPAVIGRRDGGDNEVASGRADDAAPGALSDQAQDAPPAEAELVASVPVGAEDVAGQDTELRSSASSVSQAECWICREGAAIEPLIQPCACRGSMSGVHASCVESWIKHHQASSSTGEAPCCSVCKQPYSGAEKLPGPLGYVQHMGSHLARQAIHGMVLVSVLVAYWSAAQDDMLALWLRVLLLVVVGAFFIHKLAVLCVSLPMGRLAPEDITRYAFTDDMRVVMRHVAESLTAIAISGVWLALGQVHYGFFVPLCLLAVGPALITLARLRILPCSYRAFTIVCLPLVLLIECARYFARNPYRLVDPLDAVSHSLVAAAAVLLAAIPRSSSPVVILCLAHSALLLGLLFEKLVVRSFEFKEAFLWWMAGELSIVTLLFSNFAPHGSGYSSGLLSKQPELIICVTGAWVVLMWFMALLVNRETCMRQYRAWQRRNGSFSLTADGSNQRTRQGTAGTPAEPVPVQGVAEPDRDVERGVEVV